MTKETKVTSKNQTVPTVSKFDASLLQFTPKGSFYNTQNEQMNSIDKIWNDFLEFDRSIFALSTLLPGTEYSKGRMIHKLLSSNKPIKQGKKTQIPSLLGVDNGLPLDFEKKIIDINLRNGDLPKSLKNLLMLSGIHAEETSTKIIKGKTVTIKKRLKELYLDRVNNSRTRRIILEFIFKRNLNSLEEIAVKFKRKCQKLIRHAVGKNTLHLILEGDETLMKKYIIRYNPEARGIFNFLFGKEISTTDLKKLPKIADYIALKEAATSSNLKNFQEIVDKKTLPHEVIMGFRNTFKVPIDLKVVHEKGKMSDKQSLKMESATTRAGGTKEVNYENQELYELWKVLYHKVNTKDTSKVPDVVKAINSKSEKKLDFDFGKLVVIFDSSRSMEGSEQRPLHPFLTGLSLISVLNNVHEVLYVGGKQVATGVDEVPSIVVPYGETELWRALIKAVELKPDTVMVISDGYENTIKGMFEQVYNIVKQDNKFQLIHINPVFASEVSGVRQLVKDVKPLMVDNYKYLKTNLVFEMLQERKEQIKKVLVDEFNRLLLENTNSKKKGDKK